jgi:tripartite-type tricarboxylate transporter receptor subunit TctC
MRRTSIAAAIALVLGASGMADAQDWPTRAVNLVVPYAAGGPVDTIARILAAQLSESLGQQVVVENAGGAGDMTGAARVPGQVRSERDRALGRTDQGERGERGLTR